MDNSGGGGERVLADIASGLASRGHEVVVLSYDPPGGRSYYLLDPRVERIQLGIGSTTAPATTSVTLRRMSALRKSVQVKAPDVVIGFMHSMFIPLGLALMGTSIPMIASEHIVPEHYRSRPIQALLLRLTPYLSSRITCVSEQAREAYPPSLQTKMVVVPNPVALNPTVRSDVAGLNKARKVLLSVGRLDPQKDHATLIEAFADIASEVPDWDLRIIGEGQLRPQLESIVAELGLENRIELPGGSADISAEYASAQLFVLPSRYESFGLTTVEALAHGLPVIGFDDCPGTNQLVRPGINGDLANGSGRRSIDLARTLKPFMQDAALRVRISTNLDGVPDVFHVDNVCAQWEAMLGEVMRRGKGQ